MKKKYEKFKAWRHELRRKIAQRYADLIIIKLEASTTEFEYNYWMNQGFGLDSRMVITHDIYLD